MTVLHVNHLTDLTRFELRIRQYVTSGVSPDALGAHLGPQLGALHGQMTATVEGWRLATAAEVRTGSLLAHPETRSTIRSLLNAWPTERGWDAGREPITALAIRDCLQACAVVPNPIERDTNLLNPNRTLLAEHLWLLALSQRMLAAFGNPSATVESAALGRAVYAAYGRTPPSATSRWIRAALRRETPDAVFRQPTIASVLREMEPDAVGFLRRVQWEDRQLPDLLVIRTVEARITSRAALVGTDAHIGYLATAQSLERQLEEIASSERGYARTLSEDTPAIGLRRAPLADVVLAAAYYRVRSHGDPYAIFREAQVLLPKTDANRQRIVEAIEVGLLRRVDSLLFDRRDVQGVSERRPLGWDIDERRWQHVLGAAATAEPRQMLKAIDVLEDQLGPSDPEFLRVNRATHRLIEADLVVDAIAEMRALRHGSRTTSPSWTAYAKKLAPIIFQETDGPNPPVSPGGEIVSWWSLLQRHPDVQSPAAPPLDIPRVLPTLQQPESADHVTHADAWIRPQV